MRHGALAQRAAVGHAAQQRWANARLARGATQASPPQWGGHGRVARARVLVARPRGAFTNTLGLILRLKHYCEPFSLGPSPPLSLKYIPARPAHGAVGAAKCAENAPTRATDAESRETDTVSLRATHELQMAGVQTRRRRCDGSRRRARARAPTTVRPPPPPRPRGVCSASRT